MGVISWFRRRTVGGPTVDGPPVEGQEGGGVAVLETGSAADLQTAEESMANVPTPRTGEAETLTGAETANTPEDPDESRPEGHEAGDAAMGMMDNLKGKAEELKEKASELAGKHNQKIDSVVDKASGTIDKATKGKYSDKIAQGAEMTKGAVDDFAEKPENKNPGDSAL